MLSIVHGGRALLLIAAFFVIIYTESKKKNNKKKVSPKLPSSPTPSNTSSHAATAAAAPDHDLPIEVLQLVPTGSGLKRQDVNVPLADTSHVAHHCEAYREGDPL